MDPFIAEIRLVPYFFAPQGWAFCDGQLIPIRQNTTLFAVIGTVYGGDGVNTFGLPDLRNRMPLAPGQGPALSDRYLGETGGSDTVTLTTAQIPQHTHAALAVAAGGTSNSPIGATWAQPRYGRAPEKAWAQAAPNRTLSPAALAPAGQGLPHNNLPPYTVLQYIIALEGVFPQRP